MDSDAKIGQELNTINGKHATYLKFLAKKNSRDDQSPDNPTAARLFERYIDVYMNAAVFGLLYNRTAKRDTSSDDRARVYADAFANERENCIFLYRMVMLLDKTTELTPEERVDRALGMILSQIKLRSFAKTWSFFMTMCAAGLRLCMNSSPMDARLRMIISAKPMR